MLLVNNQKVNQMESKNNKIRVGILIDSFEQRAWVYDMLKRIKQSDYAEIDLVVQNSALQPKQNRLSRIVQNYQYWLFNLYSRLDKVLNIPSRCAFEIKDATVLLEGVPIIKVAPKRDKYADLIDGQDIEEIKKHQIDVFVRLGFRILKGNILHASKFGIWSYHHGDNEVIRGGPAGFWEVFKNHPVTGATLQLLTEELDKGIVLSKTFTSTDIRSVSKNKNNNYWNALSLLPRKLKELHHLGGNAFFDKVRAENVNVKYSQTISKCPVNSEFVLYLLKKIMLLVKFKMIRVFFLHQWMLMFSLNEGIPGQLNKFAKIVPPKDRFWADPFILYKNNRYYIFIEEMKYKEGKAHISVIVMDELGNYEKPIKVLEKPYHLSYPFVFEWQGDCYMIPESGANKTLDVYRLEQFPDKCVFHKNLFNNIRAADATLFFHQEKWWLFANIQENEGTSNWVELFLYYSDNPLSDNWIPHPQNPIVSDVRRARPAGRVYEQNGKLYRPSQDCSKSYGYGLRINQILVINENEYKEVEVRYIEPCWDKNIKGIHTVNSAHKLTVVDVICRRPRQAWKQIVFFVLGVLAILYIYLNVLM